MKDTKSSTLEHLCLGFLTVSFAYFAILMNVSLFSPLSFVLAMDLAHAYLLLLIDHTHTDARTHTHTRMHTHIFLIIILFFSVIFIQYKPCTGLEMFVISRLKAGEREKQY